MRRTFAALVLITTSAGCGAHPEARDVPLSLAPALVPVYAECVDTYVRTGVLTRTAAHARCLSLANGSN